MNAPAIARRTAPVAPSSAGAVAVAAFLVVVTVLTYRVVANLNVPGAPKLPRMGMQDFRDAVYFPVRAFLDGRDPYDAPALLRAYPSGAPLAPYLPMTLVLHAPLGLLPFETAEAVYYVLLLGAILAVAYVSLRVCDVAPTVARVFGVGAAILASRPGHWSVVLGQCTPLAVLGTCIALWAGRERRLAAGLGLALAAFKPTFGAPLAVLLLARGEGPAVAIGGAIVLVISAGATAVLAAAAGGVGPFVTSIGTSYGAFSAESSVDPGASWSRIDVGALAGRLLGWSPAVGVVLGLGVLAVGALGVARLARMETRGACRLSASLACLTIVGCIYHQGYDLVLLAIPAIALASGGSAWPWRAHPNLRRVLLVLLAIPAVNYVGSENALQRFAYGPGVWLAVTSVNGLAVLATFAGFAFVALRRASDGTRELQGRIVQ
jgi:hypothetical protein